MAYPHSPQYDRGHGQGQHRHSWPLVMAMQICWITLGLAVPTPVLSSQSTPTVVCPVQDRTVNSGQTGNVVVLGQSQSRRYVVVVPADPTTLDDKTLLVTVRYCVPKAFITNSGQGLFIHAGAYAKRNVAEGVAAALRARGMDARVVYFR